MLTHSPPRPTDDNTRPALESAHPAASPPRALPAPRNSPASYAPRPAEQPPPPAAEPPAALPDVFSRMSAALSSRAVPLRRSPPRGRRRPPPTATKSVTDMFRAAPRTVSVDARGDPSEPVADAPSPSQSTQPRRRHGRASTEET